MSAIFENDASTQTVDALMAHKVVSESFDTASSLTLQTPRTSNRRLKRRAAAMRANLVTLKIDVFSAAICRRQEIEIQINLNVVFRYRMCLRSRA